MRGLRLAFVDGLTCSTVSTVTFSGYNTVFSSNGRINRISIICCPWASMKSVSVSILTAAGAVDLFPGPAGERANWSVAVNML